MITYPLGTKVKIIPNDICHECCAEKRCIGQIVLVNDKLINHEKPLQEKSLIFHFNELYQTYCSKLNDSCIKSLNPNTKELL